MSGTVLDRINRIKDLMKRADAYLLDAHKNQDSARAELHDLAAMFGIVMPPEISDDFPPRLPTGPHPTFTAIEDGLGVNGNEEIHPRLHSLMVLRHV